jgi:hypothetical protein
MSTSPCNYEIPFSSEKLVKLAQAYNTSHKSSGITLDPNNLSEANIAMLLDLYTDWLEQDFEDCLADMIEHNAFTKHTN